MSKPDFALIPPHAEQSVATVFTHGLKGGLRAADDWHDLSQSDDIWHAKIMRHLNAIRRGEYFDPDSGEPHAAHISANGMILVERGWMRARDQAKRTGGPHAPVTFSNPTATPPGLSDIGEGPK